MTVLVLDIGSSSVRAMLFDEKAQLIPNADVQKQHTFNYSNDGSASAHPDTLRNLVETCISSLLAKTSHKIDAVGISCFVGNLMGVDAKGNPITPLFTYADTRSHTSLTNITLNPDATYQRTGCRLHSSYNTVKLQWLKQTQPDTFSSVSQWLDFASYLYLQWFGDTRTSYSIASWSGLLNRDTLQWDTTWLDFLEIEKTAFPVLTDYDEPLQGLQSPYSDRWSALADVPFYLAVGDGAGANLGSGAIDSRYAALSVGSTSALRTITDTSPTPLPDGLWDYRVTAQQHLIGGATTEGGTVFAWGQNTLNISDDELTQLASRTADSHGLTVIPLFAGERSPNWNGNTRATLHGLSLSTDTIDILHALLESVALRLSIIAEMLPEGDIDIMASGGAITKSQVWAQMFADAMNRPLHIITGETSARGIAILLLSHLHNSAWSDYPPQIITRIHPQPNAVEILGQARQRQQALYNRLYRAEGD